MIKVILTTLLFFWGALTAPHLVSALDNDSNQFGQCQITINDTSVAVGSTPQVFATSNANGQATYTIKVCGNVLNQALGDQEDSPNNCIDGGDGGGPSGQELKASINTSPFYWRDFALDQFDGSCYSGTIVANDGDAWDASGVTIDIELDSDADRLCRSEMPVCQRVKAIFERQILAQDSTSCQQMRQSITSCGFLNVSTPGSQVYVNQPVTISGTINPLAKSEQCGTQNANEPRLIIHGPDGEVLDQRFPFTGEISTTFTPNRLGGHTLNFTIDDSTVYGGGGLYGASSFSLECEKDFRVCAEGDESCISFGGDSGTAGEYSICESNLGPNSTSLGACTSCYGAGGIWTAVGCISQNPRSLVTKLINVGIGISGGVALLIILASAFSLTMSQGDLKKTSDAKEWLTAAVIGLIFIILSVSILEFVGNTVLRIPGFGG